MKPYWQRSFKRLTGDLRHAGDRLSEAHGDEEVVSAIKHLQLVRTAWDAARPRDAKNRPVAI